MADPRPLSFSMKDDRALLLAFLRWLERGDGVGAYEVTEQLIKEFMEQRAISNRRET